MSWFAAHQRRRAALDAKRNAAAANDEYQKISREASWESASSNKISQAEVKRRLVQSKQQLAEQLNARRYKLAQLLEQERKQYEAEIAGTIETDASRRTRMINRAKQIQAEKKRQQQLQVAAIREQQFQDGLDEYRVLKSKAIMRECHQGRGEEIAIKQRMAEAQKEEYKRIDREYKQIAKRMLDREIREKEELARRNEETKKMIAMQVEEKKAIVAAEKAEKDADIAAWRASLALQEEAEVAKNKAIMERKIQNLKENV